MMRNCHISLKVFMKVMKINDKSVAFPITIVTFSQAFVIILMYFFSNIPPPSFLYEKKIHSHNSSDSVIYLLRCDSFGSFPLVGIGDAFSKHYTPKEFLSLSLSYTFS